jgi:hypothetical protein
MAIIPGVLYAALAKRIGANIARGTG